MERENLSEKKEKLIEEGKSLWKRVEGFERISDFYNGYGLYIVFDTKKL